MTKHQTEGNEVEPAAPRRRVFCFDPSDRLVFVQAQLLLAAVPAWYAMTGLHEFGHVLNAWLSGGVVRQVHFGLWEFPFTEYAANPRPRFVAWGGFVWGCVLPLMILLPAWAARAPRLLRRILTTFAGFCLLANGFYFAIGQFDGVGDTGDLLRLGVARWKLAIAGCVALVGGIGLWLLALRDLLKERDALIARP